MTRDEIVNLRRAVYGAYKERVALGEFDANSGTIQLTLHTLVDLLDHTLIEMKKAERAARDVHGKTTPTPTGIPSRRAAKVAE